jgi:diguanylate cyclase
MNETKHPSEIAREALRLLVARKQPPTPANFQASYNEVANLPNIAPFPDQALRHLMCELVAKNDIQEKALRRFDEAVGRRSWLNVEEALLAFIAASDGAPVVGFEPLMPDLSDALASKLAQFIESVLPALGDDNEQVMAMSGDLLEALRQPVVDVPQVQGKLSRLTRLVLFAAEEQVEIKESLLKLLHLIIENIGELSLDDAWLKGQIDGLLVVVAPPLTLRHLDEMGRRLRDVMAKQQEAKSRALVVQKEMRQMLEAFIERLAMMSESSVTFQGKIEESARQIENVRKIEDLAPLLKDVIAAARTMADDSSYSREQLKTLQERVLSTEAELIQLHRELDSASTLARHDPLTDTLNRKGLDEALAREIATMLRKETPLSLCLLDIDNFKKLNDRLGHAVGDSALIHLVDVARRCMRPTDTLARYGGEEFIILMPDTSLDHGIEAMVRLQRELTKAFFLYGNEKVLITFSAGVAQLAQDETALNGIKRADRAMYLAKRAGKNRVMAG